MTIKRTFFVVRDKDCVDSKYNTESEAVNAVRDFWKRLYPQFAPFAVLRIDVLETEVDLLSENAK